MNKILKLTLVLFLICAIVAGVLGVVNELTYRRIDAQEQAKDAMQDTFLKIRGAAHLYVPQGKPCRRMRDFAGS